MSLFVCSNPECRAVENTAVSNFWSFLYDKSDEALCSACDPKIGKWHGLFEKQVYDPARHRVQYDGTTHLTDQR